MRIRNTDKQWDWTFGNGQSNYVRNVSAIAVDIKMRLWEWYQDCFFNLEQGIPWDIRLGSHNQKDLLDKDVISTVSSIEGVLNTYNFESIVVGRNYKCSFDVYTIYSSETVHIDFEGV